MRPPPEHFTEALFNRFRPFKVKVNAVELEDEMDIIDFCLAMSLLSRIHINEKVKSKFSTHSCTFKSCSNFVIMMTMDA